MALPRRCGVLGHAGRFTSRIPIPSRSTVYREIQRRPPYETMVARYGSGVPTWDLGYPSVSSRQVAYPLFGGAPRQYQLSAVFVSTPANPLRQVYLGTLLGSRRNPSLAKPSAFNTEPLGLTGSILEKTVVMSLRAIGQMVRLRYKLMWARTRFRSGRIALFAVGCLLLAMLVILLSAAGIGTGIIAIRSGKSQLVVQAVLGGLYVEALLASVLTGFGLSTVFTDAQLRRYPISAMERWITRHLIGIADPFWFLILTLEVGLATGICIMGDLNPLAVSSAVLLQFISNYLLARVVGLGIDRLVSRNAGSVLLVLLILVATFLASALGPLRENNKAIYVASLQVLNWTPPFGAAACIAKSGFEAIYGFSVLVGWVLGLGAVLTYIERLPPHARAAQSGNFHWDNVFDRMGASVDRQNAPLIAFWLRFYWRNTRLRAMYALSLPVTAFLTFAFGKGMGKLRVPPQPIDPNSTFHVALGAIFVVSFLAMSRFAMNQFGYVGGAFRRFLLLPIDSAASMRAGSRASMLVGGSLIPVALFLWVVFGGPFDARKLIMLLGSAVTGLFTQHAAALWVTLYGPRKVSYTSSAGNDMSVMANVVVTGGTACALFTPQLLARHLPGAISPENCWVVVPVVSTAILFYVLSLRATSRLFTRKREGLMAVLEGKVR